jgi:N-acetylglutamate synthase-like GNAT family acetyltransferase
MIRGKYLTSSDDCAQVLHVRKTVCGQGADGHDKMAVYALAYDEAGVPSGSGRLYLDEDRFVIGCVTVLPEARGKGLGDLLMRMLLFRAQELGAPYAYALVCPGDEPFYARYGFQPAGEELDEQGRSLTLLRVKSDEIVENDCHGCKA